MKKLNQLPWAHYSRQQSTTVLKNLQRQRPCPLCDAQDDTEQLTLKDFQFFDDANAGARITHRAVQCDGCGMLYTNPCYTAEGFQVLFAKAGQSYGHSEGRCQEQAGWLLDVLPDCKSVVDIGCGSGDFLSALPDSISRVGLDIDVPSIKHAMQHKNSVQFVASDIGGQFDPPVAQVYTLFHLLEHLPDPVQTLTQLRHKAEPTTQLVIEVPVIDRAVQEQAQDIVGFFSIQHLSHFSRATLKSMLRATGWHIIKAELIAGYNGYRVLAQPCDAVLELPDNAESVKTSSDLGGYMQVWKQNIVRANNRLRAIASDAKVIVWGAGQHAEYLALLTNLFSENRQYIFVDNDPLKQGTAMHGIPVVSADSIDDEFWRESNASIVVSTYGGQDAVVRELVRRGVNEQRIIKLYDKVNRY